MISRYNVTMKKLLPFALLFVLASPAQAQVASKKVEQSPDEVRAYWTEERMKNARVPRAKGGKAGGGGGTTSSWSTLPVNWTSAPAITRAHGKVFFSDGQYNYVCSGTAVGGGVVWTAGHCVNEGPGAMYRNWMFIPAYNAGTRAPHGEWPASELFTTAEWQSSGEFGRDLGAAQVGPVEAAVGAARTIDTTPVTTLGTGNQMDSYGYPAEGKYNGQTMYMCDSYLGRMDTSTTPDTYGIPCGMNGGSSGGGWIDTTPGDGDLISVNSYGYGSLKNTMFGPQQDSAAAALLQAAR